MSIIRMEDINFKYKKSDTRALKDLNLSIGYGELVGIVGRSNSGKSTLLKAMRGFIPHYLPGEFEGNVYYNEKNILEYEIHNLTRYIGYVFENSFVYETGSLDTVYDELEFSLENLGMKKNMMIAKIEEVLRYLDLYHLRYKNPKDLSPGERQLLSLASVVAMDRNLIILDEPISALNIKKTRLVMDLLKKLKSKNKTIILASKTLDNLVEVADRIILLDEGRIVLEATSEEMMLDSSIVQYGVFTPEFFDVYKKLLAEGIPIKKIPKSIGELEKELKNIFDEVR